MCTFSYLISSLTSLATVQYTIVCKKLRLPLIFITIYYHLQASVCPHGGGGTCLSACSDTSPPRSRHPSPAADNPREQTTPPGADTPPPKFFLFFLHFSSIFLHFFTPPNTGDGHCCGLYASYWNAFLLVPICFFTARKRSNVFSQACVCQSICPLEG